MSRGYSATPLLGLSRNSAVAGIFSWKSPGYRVNARDFEQCKHIETIVLAICWRLSRFQSPSHEKRIFLKIRSLFSFKFFQGHNWLTNYPNSEFHGRWKTVTLSSISLNLSKHWRFWAFWLSLCFGSFLLFQVCHDTAFLFSTRVMTALGWLPNAHRDMIIWYGETGDCVIHRGLTQDF